MRIKFCGVVEGSITIRKGETRQQALERAEEMLQGVLEKHARSLKSPNNPCPVFGMDYSACDDECSTCGGSGCPECGAEDVNAE